MIDKFRTVLAGKLPPGSFIRNVVTLMTGTTFAQALMILVAPILTRLYSPEDFGIYALYISILGIIAVVACWRYELAIVLSEKDEDAANLLVLSICICFGMAVLTLVLVTLFRNPVANLLGAPKLAPWLWFMPLSLIVAGLFQAFNYWSTRRKQFGRLAIRQITLSTVTAATQLGTGFALHPGPGPGGLISGSITGQLVATGRLAWQIGNEEGRQIITKTNKYHIEKMLILHKKFPLFDSWSEFLNTASAVLPVLLLGYFFNPAVVGFYALGQRVLSLPMGVIGGSIAQVFFPRATKAQHDGELYNVTLDLFKRILAIGFVPLMLIAIVAPDLFAIVFGDRWYTAGQYVRWMSLWLFFQFISSPLSTIYYVMDRQRDLLLFNLVIFFVRLLVIIVGGIRGDILFTIALLGITGAILYGFLCMHITNIAGITAFNVLFTVFKQVVFSIPFCILPLLVWYISSSSLVFVSAAIASGLIFLLIRTSQVNKSGVLI
ncbi:MAG TPA: translocase [Clostridiales bacterium]|jgi:O-antigen/teichoic acid export membrane protein|nr:translocase [Clostridiales bacterium]